MSKVKAAIFASGTGSNFLAITEQATADQLGCEIVLLVCDQPDAPVIQLAKRYRIPVLVFRPKSYSGKEVYEEEIRAKLQELDIEWIFLAGYMRIVGDTLIDAYPNRIVNLHPSLLPAFPGKDAIGRAYQANVPTTGVTVHYVDAGVDTGPIIDQISVAIEVEDTEEILKQRIQQVEHHFYSSVIQQLIDASDDGSNL